MALSSQRGNTLRPAASAISKRRGKGLGVFTGAIEKKMKANTERKCYSAERY